VTEAARGRRSAAGFAALLLLLLCLIPPDGVLSPNEENYFQLAAESVSAAPVSPETAVFDSSYHRVLADHLLGWLIAGAGYGGAQILARLLAAVAYALALGALFRRFGLDALDGVIALVVFALLGQSLFGGEWLFHGAESKVAAYIMVLAGLALVLEGGRLYRIAPLFAAATYFHFLVGVFWFFAALVLRLVEDRRELRRALAAAGLFAVLIAPLMAMIAWSRLGAAASAPAGMPPVDFIYSFFRVPYHTAPFLTAGVFVAQWLPGCLLGGGMLIACFVLARLPEAARFRPVALWLALLLLYLALAFVAAALDRHTGALGKFYLFRPASLLLLLWLALMLRVLGCLELRYWLTLRLLVLALLLPLFLLHAATRIVRDFTAAGRSESAKLADLLARQPDGAVLIDPDLEPQFFAIERLTRHPALVLWKFVPTDDAEIIEWYRRLQFRGALFARGCTAPDAYPFAFLLATREHAALLAPNCGAPLGSAGPWVLLSHG
jgi:hypothetical protein